MKLRTIMLAAMLVAATALVTKRVVSQDEDAGVGDGGGDGCGGSMNGAPRKGTDILGLWLDNMSTAFMLSRDKPFRTITRVTREGESVYQMHVPGADGKQYKALQVTARRR